MRLMDEPDGPDGVGTWVLRGRGVAEWMWSLCVLVVAAWLVMPRSAFATGGQEASDLVAGLNRLATVSGELATVGPLGRSLALTNGTAANGSGLGFSDLFLAAISRRLNSPQSLSDVAAQLTTNGTVDLGSERELQMSATAVSATGGSTVDRLLLSVSVTRQAAGVPLSHSAATPTPLVLSGGAAATEELSLTGSLEVDYDTVTRQVALDASAGAPTLALDATVTAQAGASAAFGILGVTLGAPSGGSMLSSSTSLVVGFGQPAAGAVIPIVAPDGSGQEAPTTWGQSALSAAYAASARSTISGAVALAADTSGGLSGLGSIAGTVAVSDADVAGGAIPVVSLSGLDAAAGFATLTPADLAAGLSRAISFLDAVQTATVSGPGGHTLGDIALPLMKGRLSDTFDAGEAIQAFLDTHVGPGARPDLSAGQPDFSSLQQMVAELDATSTDGATVAVDPPTYAASKVTLTIHVHGARSNVPLDPDDGSGTPDLGEVDMGSQLAGATGIAGLAATTPQAIASPTYDLTLPLVLDVSPPQSALTAADRIRVGLGSPLLQADVPITTAVDATGQVGALGIHAGGMLTVSPPSHGHMLSLSLAGSGDITLAQLTANLASSPGSVLSAANGGSLQAQIGFDAPGQPGFFGTPCSNESQAATCIDATIAQPDISDPSTLSVSGSELGVLKAFDFAGKNSEDLLASLASRLDTLSRGLGHLNTLADPAASGPLNSPLPLLGMTVGDAISTDALDGAVTALRNAPPTTLAAAVQTLATALGAGSSVSLAVGGSASGPELLVHLVDSDVIDRSVPLDVPLSLSSGPVGLTGATGTGTLEVKGTLELNLTVAVAVSDATAGSTPDDVQVLPASSVKVALDVDASGQYAANLGPYAVRLGASGDPATVHAAVDLSLTDSGAGTDPVGFGAWAQGLTASLNRSSQPVTCDGSESGYDLDVCAQLPVYLSSDGGRTFSKVSGNANNDLFLRLPAADPTFNPGGPPIPGPSGKPALDRIDLPDGLDTALANALISFGSLRWGADAFLQLLSDAVDNASNGGRLPFVGSDLQEGHAFLATLQDNLDSAFDALPDAQGLSAGAIRSDIEQALASTLGSTLQGAVAVDVVCGDADCADSDPATSISKITVSFDAGSGSADLSSCGPGVIGCASFSTPLELGIPGLSITSTDPASDRLSGGVGWRIHVAFGVDAEGFFVAPGNKVTLGIGVSAPASLKATLAVLQVDLSDLNHGSVPLFAGTATAALTNTTNLHLGDLLSAGSSVFDAELSAQARADWHLQATANSELPGIGADFHLAWGWSSQAPDATAPTVLDFDNVSVVPGAFLTGALGPIARGLNQALGPFQPVLDGLTEPLPVFSDLSHLAGGQDITVLGLLGIAGDLSGDERVQMADRVATLASIINQVSEAVGSEQPIPIGSLEIDPDAALAGYAPDQIVAGTAPGGQDWSQLTSTMLNAMFPNDRGVIGELLNPDTSGFSFPILEHPEQLLGLLIGQDVNVVRYDAGSLDVDLGPPLDNLGFSLDDLFPVSVGATGDLRIQGHFSAGYDTNGFRQAIADGNPVGVLDGLYIDTRDDQGNQTPNLQLDGTAALYGRVNAELASAEVDGWITLDGSLGLNDPTNTGKFRVGQFANLSQGVGCVFAAHSESSAFLDFSAELGHDPLSKTWTDNIARTPLFDVTTGCPQGEGGGGYGGYRVESPPPLGTVQTVDSDHDAGLALNDQGTVRFDDFTNNQLVDWQAGQATNPRRAAHRQHHRPERRRRVAALRRQGFPDCRALGCDRAAGEPPQRRLHLGRSSDRQPRRGVRKHRAHRRRPGQHVSSSPQGRHPRDAAERSRRRPGRHHRCQQPCKRRRHDHRREVVGAAGRELARPDHADRASPGRRGRLPGGAQRRRPDGHPTRRPRDRRDGTRPIHRLLRRPPRSDQPGLLRPLRAGDGRRGRRDRRRAGRRDRQTGPVRIPRRQALRPANRDLADDLRRHRHQRPRTDARRADQWQGRAGDSPEMGRHSDARAAVLPRAAGADRARRERGQHRRYARDLAAPGRRRRHPRLPRIPLHRRGRPGRRRRPRAAGTVVHRPVGACGPGSVRGQR